MRTLPAIITCLLLLLLQGCGGSSDPVQEPDDSFQITNVQISQIGANGAVLSYSTSTTASSQVQLWFNSKGERQPDYQFQTQSATEHQLQLAQLWSDSRWHVEISSQDQLATTSFSTTMPDWPSVCRAGSLSLGLNASNWSVYTDSNGSITTSQSTGCQGNNDGVRFDFDLGSGEWAVAAAQAYSQPLDLSSFSHLWVPFRGTEGLSVALEIKLEDTQGAVAVARLDGATGLPVWRSWAVDLRQFRPQVGDLDLTQIAAIQVGFSWPSTSAGPRSGSVWLSPLQAWNIATQVEEVSRFEPLPFNTEEMELIAQDLLSRQQSHGFIPAWYDLAPNWHLYANAMALIVFTLEYERLEAISSSESEQYRIAAKRMADELVRLQQLSERQGAWDDSFAVQNGQLTLHPEGSRILWVGSTAWAGIALIYAYDILPNGSDYGDAIALAADYYQQQQQCRTDAGLPTGSITEGTEGNISSHLFLAAAVKRGLTEALTSSNLRQFISEHLFDSEQNRFFCGVEVDFGGGFDEQSCQLAGSGEILRGDATACLDVVANWGVAWLLQEEREQDAYTALAFSRELFPTQGFTNSSVKGLGDIAGPWSPTVEHGAGQWAAVGGPDSNFIMNQATEHLCSDGQCQGAADNFSAGIGWNTQARGISPTAWMYLAWHGGFWDKL